MLSQEIIRLYDAFTHGQIDRRSFLSRLATIAGGMTSALSVLSVLENDYSRIPPVPADVQVAEITYQGVSGVMKAFSAQPEAGGPWPAVIVIHENRGLNPYIRDVATRVAGAGFWAIAPDALSQFGGTPEDQDEARELIGDLDPATTIGDFVAAVEFAREHPMSSSHVGCVGFCWGGRMANQLAVHCENLRASVAFYGSQPEVADVPRIRAAVMLHYAGLDDRINAGIPAYVDALKAAGIEYQMFIYDEVNHAFHNHTSPTRYNEAAATRAWQRTIDFFNQQLKN